MKLIKLFFFNFLCIFVTNNLLADSVLQENMPLLVLFFVNNFPTNTGGSTLNQVIGFVKNNHDVTILTQNFNDSSINMSHPDIQKYDLFSKVFVKELPDDKREFDVILCQSTSLAIQLLDFVEKYNVKGKKIVFVRGADIKIFNDAQKCERIFESFDMIAPVCEYFKNKLTKLNKNRYKLKVLHSSIDCSKFTYSRRFFPKKSKTVEIVSVSRLARKKGLDIAINAIFLLIKKYSNIRYRIIGDGSLKKKLRELINKLGLKRHVFLVGWKTPNEVRKILNESHISILPSVTRNAQEGIPNALKEAMAMGLPVVGTYHAGIPELIEDGVTGFLVPEEDVIGLAKKIFYLIKRPKIWNRIGKAARNFVVKHFERETENRKLIQVCYELCYM